jgi:hypothetical protein
MSVGFNVYALDIYIRKSIETYKERNNAYGFLLSHRPRLFPSRINKGIDTDNR